MDKKIYDIPPVSGLDLQLGLLSSMLDDGTREWRGELDNIAQEAITWQPFPQSHSIGSVILHIADVEASWIHEVGANQKLSEEQLKLFMTRQIKQDDVEWPVPPNEPIEYFWNLCDDVRKRSHELIHEIGDPCRSCPSDEAKNQFTLRWILHHVITHEAYHGGQIVFLNLMHTQMRG